MTTTAETTAPRRQRLVEELEQRGAVTSSQWRDAFLTVPRDKFLTRFAVSNPAGEDQWYDLTDPTTREAALDAVYSNHTLITQYDETGRGISSSTEPSLMAVMLKHLDVQPHSRVMEQGFGVGYNAALLCTVVGDGNVASIDIDPTCVHTGRAALRRMGMEPYVVVGDGANGIPNRAPFDRIITTCGFDRVPPAWLKQATTEAVIVVNLGFALARLTTSPDGAASGPLVDAAAFMPRRPTVDTLIPATQDLLNHTSGEGQTTRSCRPDALAGMHDRTFQVLRSLAFPALRHIAMHHDTHHEYRWTTTTGAWSRFNVYDDHAELVEHGPGSIVADLEQLLTQWNDHGRPHLTRYGVTVLPDGTHLLWLDDPQQTLRVLH